MMLKDRENPNRVAEAKKRGKQATSFLGRRNFPCSFVPTFLSQPCFEVKQAHLRKARLQGRNVGVEPRFVEPTKHLVEFLSQYQTNKRQRKLLKLNLLTEHAAENFRRLNIGELTARDFQF
jgi:hypothetical protein